LLLSKVAFTVFMVVMRMSFAELHSTLCMRVACRAAFMLSLMAMIDFYFYFFFYFIHTAGKPKAYGIIKENPATAKNKKNKRNPPHGHVLTTNSPFLQSTAI